MSPTFCENDTCIKCGRCCHFRREETLTDTEEWQVKLKVFERTGIVYLYRFKQFGLSIKPEERRMMLEEAQKLCIELAIKPKKIQFNPETDKFTVFDWFIDHDTCPFQDSAGLCSIYEKRPQVCREFPQLCNHDIMQQPKGAQQPYADVMKKLLAIQPESLESA